jgi:hypothetical protein
MIRFFNFSVVFLIVLMFLFSGCSFNKIKPVPWAPSLKKIEPLDKPAFKNVRVETVRQNIKDEKGKRVEKLPEMKEPFEKALKSVPFFEGGEWPELNLDVDFVSVDSGVGGCWLLLVPTVLLWPASWITGMPNYCHWMEVKVVIKAQVGEFSREYKYSLVDYSAGNVIYYKPAPFDGVPLYVGHAIWEFSKKISSDYQEFLDGELESNPRRYSKSLNPDLKKWYNEGWGHVDSVKQMTDNTIYFTNVLLKIHDHNNEFSVEIRVAAVKELALWGAKRMLIDRNDAWAAQTIISYGEFSTNNKFPKEVREASFESAEQLKCVKKCVENESCISSCGFSE